MKHADLLKMAGGDVRVAEMIRAIPQSLLDAGTLITYKPGQEMVHANDVVRSAYFLLTGEVEASIETYDGKMSTYLTIRPPTVISDLEIMSSMPHYVATITVTGKTLVFKCGAEAFLSAIRTHIDLLWQVTSQSARNNFSISFNNGQVVFRSSTDKTMHRLIQYCRAHPPAADRCTVVGKTRQALASELAISIKTVNRSLSQLKAEGFISIEQRKITIDQQQHARMEEYWREQIAYMD